MQSTFLLISLAFAQTSVLQLDNSGYCLDAEEGVPFATGCYTLEYSTSLTSNAAEFGIERGIGSCLQVKSSNLVWSPCPSTSGTWGSDFLWKNTTNLLESKANPGKCLSYTGRNKWNGEGKWNKLILDECARAVPIVSRSSEEVFPAQAPKLDLLLKDNDELKQSVLGKGSCYYIHVKIGGIPMFLDFFEKFGLAKGRIEDLKQVNQTLNIQRLFKAIPITDSSFQLKLDTRCLSVRDNQVKLEPCLKDAQKGSAQELKLDCFAFGDISGNGRQFCGIGAGSNCVVYTKAGILILMSRRFEDYARIRGWMSHGL
jgi:hypothetical protein